MRDLTKTTFRDIEASRIVFGQASRNVIRMAAMSLGKTIKQFRKLAGLTQAELADACGWGADAQNRVSNYERDIREPTLADLGLMAKAMGVSILDIVAASEDPANYALFKRISALDPNQKHFVKELVNSYDPKRPDKQ